MHFHLRSKGLRSQSLSNIHSAKQHLKISQVSIFPFQCHTLLYENLSRSQSLSFLSKEELKCRITDCSNGQDVWLLFNSSWSQIDDEFNQEKEITKTIGNDVAGISKMCSGSINKLAYVSLLICSFGSWLASTWFQW